MQTHFQRATLSMTHEDIITSAFPPLPGFSAPPIIETFYKQVEEQQAKRGHEVAGGFAFGGMFSDIPFGKKAKDLDIYIAVPRLLGRLAARADEPVCSYRDRQEREDDLNAIIGYSFPLNIDLIDLQPKRADLFGNYIAGKMLYTAGGEEAVLDVIVGQEPLPLPAFLPHAGAPIMAAGMTLGGERTEYAYHKDHPAHAQRGILCADGPCASMLEKAERKNWTVMSRAEWAEPRKRAAEPSLDAAPALAPS